MTKPQEILEGLWTFPIVLPDNPLKWLNCYIIKGAPGGRNLLIDTGFKRPECQSTLFEGMAALDIRPEETDVFLTHTHSDHAGNAATLESMGCRIMMSEIDYQLYMTECRINWTGTDARILSEGMPKELLDAIHSTDPTKVFQSSMFTPDLVHEGDTFTYGSYTLQCILTPGHTPGHMCLYESEKKVMFLGDHVLFDISPNICYWAEAENSLGMYLESLHKIRNYDVEYALPAHRNTSSLTMQQRIDQLLEHHERRLNETVRIIQKDGPINAYQLAGKMTWRIRAKNWDEFPQNQKWFATCETLAHLDYLISQNKIRKITSPTGDVTYII